MTLDRKQRWWLAAILAAAVLALAFVVSRHRSAPASSPATADAVPHTVSPGAEVAAATGSQESDMLKMARAAFEACGAPTAPVKVPDGKSATREQMVAAHETVQAFDEATNIYTRCLDTTAYQTTVQFKSVAKDADAEALSALQVRLHNEAIDRDQELANRFNVQLRIFKARK